MTDEQAELLREGKMQDLLNAYDEALAELFNDCIDPEDHDEAMNALNDGGLDGLWKFMGWAEPTKH